MTLSPETRTTELQYTSAQFYDLVPFLREPYRYELHAGRIVQFIFASMLASTTAARIVTYISRYTLDNECGHVTSARGAYILSEDYTLVPAVGYISYERQPNVVEGFVPHAPDLAAEVLSPMDDLDKAREKAHTYIAHGTRLVWLVLPTEKQVEIYQPDADPQTLDKDATLSGEPVLPGFTLTLDKIFISKT